jgi:HD-GYP domain-containing protein (c-di-GMP phosphodiesterase class II)
MISQHARLARSLAEQLQLPAAVAAALAGSYERWDGKGWPGRLSGDDIPIAARIAQLSEFIEVAHRAGGASAAVALAEGRKATQFDPALVRCVRSDAAIIFDGLEAVGTWAMVIASEPALNVVLTEAEFDAALTAIADFVDLKSPYTLGHSRGVAELASAAGAIAGLPPDDIVTLRRSALVHHFGRLGVSNAIWDKPGPLGPGEWERVRMYPYLTERMLKQSTALGSLGRVAAQHRERMDGTGYPRGLAGHAISPLARLLGVADAYQAMREPRAYRPPRSSSDAASLLRTDIRNGHLDGDAVEAVVAAAGHRRPRRREGLAGLTGREIEVLTLLARGYSNKQIAARLVISPKTAGNHVEHIYTKIDASSRAAASLFAVQHGLLPEEEVDHPGR